jgi:autotransporter passenger strand-loop-strand repeat protein
LVSSTLNTYASTVAAGQFGNPVNTFVGSNKNDQPWIITGPNNYVYVAYNNLGASFGQTASVNISNDGGESFPQVITLDRIGGWSGQDDAAVRIAGNGNTVYAVFDRWNATIQSDSSGSRYASQLVVVKTTDAGADGFTAIGAGGNGVQVAAHVGVFTTASNTDLSIGQNRIAGGDLSIAVDPNDANHVVVAYSDAPGPDGDGVVQLVVAESKDGGATWSQKFTTSEDSRSSQPALAILANGTIGFLYDSYTPSQDGQPNVDGELSQHFVTTADDFVTTNDMTLAGEINNSPGTFLVSPYLGDFFNLTSFGDTFHGIFSALNTDNGTDATINNVRFQRDFTGTPGTNSFQLVTSGGAPVSASVDPFVFNLTTQLVASGALSSGASVSNGQLLELLSGGTAAAATVLSGGMRQVDASGHLSGAVLSSAGVLDLMGSSGADAVTLLSGASVQFEGGFTLGRWTVGSGATLSVGADIDANATTVLSGGAVWFRYERHDQQRRPRICLFRRLR